MRQALSRWLADSFLLWLMSDISFFAGNYQAMVVVS